MYKKKFKKGRKITKLNDAVNIIMNKKQFIFYRHKPYHCGWSMSWSLITLKRFIDTGEVYTAKEI